MVDTRAVTRLFDDPGELTDRLDEKAMAFPWLQGAARGVVAFFLGWAAIGALSVLTASGNEGPILGQLTVLGLLFYNFQFVPLRTVNHYRPWLDGSPINPAAAAGTALVPKFVYYLVPVAVLLGVGAELGYRTGDDESPVLHSLFCGLSIAVGYVAMALLFAALLSYPTNYGHAARPDLLWTAGMGVEYAVVFGSVGAFAGQFASS